VQPERHLWGGSKLLKMLFRMACVLDPARDMAAVFQILWTASTEFRNDNGGEAIVLEQGVTVM
jgi:hypothetical protein